MDRLYMHIINVDMRGSGILLQSDTHTILIDLAFETGTDNLENYLHSKNITDIDLLVITHPHRDHMAGQGAGGLQRFTNAFNVSEIWSNGVPYPVWYDGVTVSPYGPDSIVDYESYLNHIYPGGHTVMGENDYPGIQGIGTPIIPYHEPREGDVYQYGEITLKILNPQKPHKRSHTNASSIVMQVIFQGKKIMLTADSIFDSENDILAKYSVSDLKSDILYLGHHGIEGSTSSTWFNAVNPSLVTAQRREHLLPTRVKYLINNNGSKLYDPYRGEDYYSPNRGNFTDYVFEISSEGITVTPDDVQKITTNNIVSLYANSNLQECYMKKNGEWVASNTVYTNL